jgi:hypothetical protein
MRKEIILIGPLCSGKSSVALFLAEKLNILNYPIDRIKWYYRFKNGYNLSKGTKILRNQGFMALLEYSEPFFCLKEIEISLNEFRGGVFDFGASHSYFTDNDLLKKASKLLEPFKNVVLLQPSPDKQECIKVLSERIRQRYTENQRSERTIESYVKANEYFINHKSNSILSKHVIYTYSKSIEDVGNEILKITKYNSDQ